MGVDVDALNKWLVAISESPAGSLMLFILVFLVRVSADEYQRRKERERRPHKPRSHPRKPA